MDGNNIDKMMGDFLFVHEGRRLGRSNGQFLVEKKGIKIDNFADEVFLSGPFLWPTSEGQPWVFPVAVGPDRKRILLMVIDQRVYV